MTRPCQWPDGGCGQPVEFFPTGRTKPDGKPVLQVVDAQPEKRIVLEHSGRVIGNPALPITDGTVARVVTAWVDHHATCSAFKARTDRARRARAARP
jgi:hypothetical protein